MPESTQQGILLPALKYRIGPHSDPLFALLAGFEDNGRWRASRALRRRSALQRQCHPVYWRGDNLSLVKRITGISNLPDTDSCGYPSEPNKHGASPGIGDNHWIRCQAEGDRGARSANAWECPQQGR